MSRAGSQEPEELVFVEKTASSSRQAPELHLPAVGQWYWVGKDVDDPEDYKPWLGCVTHQGTNYVEVTSRNSGTRRIHECAIEKWLTHEPNAEAIIASKIAEQRLVIGKLTADLRQLMGRLALTGQTVDNETKAIAVCSGKDDVKTYKKALVRAKDKTVPAIMKGIEEASKEMASWMNANMIPLAASIEQLKTETEIIEKRIFGVELYAGLVEQVTEIQSGEPAGMNEPVRIFQRRCYMDEECLSDYDAGGMEFANIKDFDAWLLRPGNLRRILPFARSIVAFQVRRYDKKHKASSIMEFVRMLFDDQNQLDKTTFLYIRNGEQVFRLQTEIPFKVKLFPDIAQSILHVGKLYAIGNHDSFSRLATEGEYLDKLREEAEEAARIAPMSEHDQFFGRKHISEPSHEWTLWDQDSVYYDDISRFVKDQLDDHNRLVLVLQGLFDRSMIFSPHPAYKLWVHEDFDRAIKPIHDDSRALSTGALPDFKAYQGRLNAMLCKGATTVGQDPYWQKTEAVRENEKLRGRLGRNSDRYFSMDTYKPTGNPGPGIFAEVQAFSKAKGCTYTWMREKMTWSRWGGNDRQIGCRLTVPVTELLNVDVYTPGDYHLFYDDPRTRAEYLEWAPLLLRAEEWWAKKPERSENPERPATAKPSPEGSGKKG